MELVIPLDLGLELLYALEHLLAVVGIVPEAGRLGVMLELCDILLGLFEIERGAQLFELGL